MDDHLDLRQRMAEGDHEAWVAYIEAHRSQLLAYIDRRIGTLLATKVDPEDILQDVSVSAIKSLSEVSTTDRDPFGWLCQLATRRILDTARRLRSDKRDVAREVPITGGDASQSPGLLGLLVASLTTPTQALARDQRQQKLMNALETLSEESREAIRLRYIEGLPSREIATRLGKSDGAVRVLLTRALNRLRQELGTEAAP